MKRTIVLCAAVALFAGCKGDVSQQTPPENQSSHQNAANPSAQTPSNSTDSKLNDPTGPPQAGYESPEAVFAAFQQAIEDEDLPAFVRCMDDETQEGMAKMGMIQLAFMALDPDNKEEIEELLSKHGMSLKQDTGEFPIKTTEGRIALMTDMMNWMKEQVGSSAEESAPLKGLVDATLGEVTIEGDTARAALTLSDNSTDEMEFRRIGGTWFVHDELKIATRSQSSKPFGDSGSGTFGDSDFGTFGGVDEPPPPIEAVPLAKFQSAWQVTLNVQDRPARELLAKLAEELGLELEASPQAQSKLQKPVSLDVADVSRFQAIEEIARQLELTPKYSRSALSFEPGQRKLPVVFAGPFLIELKEFETAPKTATGQISLNVLTAGLPPVVQSRLNEAIGGPVEITTVTDKDGRNLQRNLGNEFMSLGSLSPVFHNPVSVGLKNLLRSVEAVSKIEGVISISLPTKVEVLKFDELKPGAETKAGDVTVKLKQVDGGSVSLEYSGTDFDRIQLLAFDAQGKQLESFGSSSFGGGGKGETTENYHGTPARIEARIVTQQEELAYEFRMKDIPVPNHSAMPEQLAELKFDGESPVSLKFDSIAGDENFREIKIQVTNHSNKDAEALTMQLGYFDQQGKALSNNTTISHGLDTIPAGESLTIEVTAFSMPEATKSVKATLKRVKFTDATEWQAKR